MRSPISPGQLDEHTRAALAPAPPSLSLSLSLSLPPGPLLALTFSPPLCAAAVAVSSLSRKNINTTLQRGEDLNQMEDKASVLEQQGKQFHSNAVKLRRKFCMQVRREASTQPMTTAPAEPTPAAAPAVVGKEFSRPPVRGAHTFLSLSLPLQSYRLAFLILVLLAIIAVVIYFIIKGKQDS